MMPRQAERGTRQGCADARPSGGNHADHADIGSLRMEVQHARSSWRQISWSTMVPR
jgi:hypothetical protein